MNKIATTLLCGLSATLLFAWEPCYKFTESNCPSEACDGDYVKAGTCYVYFCDDTDNCNYQSSFPYEGKRRKREIGRVPEGGEWVDCYGIMLGSDVTLGCCDCTGVADFTIPIL